MITRWEPSRPRFAFAAQFRYVARPWLRLQLGPEFTWASYLGDQADPVPRRPLPGCDQTKGQVPHQLRRHPARGAHYVMRRGSWLYHAAAAAPDLSRLGREQPRGAEGSGHVQAPSRSLRGVSAHLGAEKFFRRAELHLGGVRVRRQPGLHRARRSVQVRIQQQRREPGDPHRRQLLLRTPPARKQKPAEAASPTTK